MDESELPPCIQLHVDVRAWGVYDSVWNADAGLRGFEKKYACHLIVAPLLLSASEWHQLDDVE